MAGKNSKSYSVQEAHRECGDCFHAYGYCWPVEGGAPYFCRCPLHPHTLLRVKDLACNSFDLRKEPRPAKAMVKLSASTDSTPESEKVVPLFREGEQRPWKYVPVSEIPKGGISWDGSPAINPSSPELHNDTEW